MKGEKTLLRLFSLIVGTIGIVLMAKYSNWHVALGVFLFVWGDSVANYTRRMR